MVTLALAGLCISFSWCETINVARAQCFWKFDLWHHDSDRLFGLHTEGIKQQSEYAIYRSGMPAWFLRSTV
jgi:hypothetical protein